MTTFKHPSESNQGKRKRWRWADFIAGRPTPGFMLWARRILAAVWLLFAIAVLPSFLEQAQLIFSCVPGSPERNSAIRTLLAEVGLLYGLPALLITTMGHDMYDARMRISSGLSTGLWYGPSADSMHIKKKDGK